MHLMENLKLAEDLSLIAGQKPIIKFKINFKLKK